MIIARLAARMILTVVASLMLWAALPAAWGWLPTTVMSDSMAPRIMRGDVVVAIPIAPERLHIGKIALVEDPDHPGRLRLHRVVAIENGQVMTKGDANPQPDSTPVRLDAVKGVGILRVPYAGYPIVWLREHDVIRLAAVAAALSGVLLAAFPSGSKPGSSADRRVRRRHAGAALIGLVAAAGLASTALGSTSMPSHASFSAQAASPSTTLTTATSFSCLAVTPADNPYLYYAFTETSGATVHDSSSNGRTGELHGTYAHVPGSCSDSPAITFGDQGFVSTPTAVSDPTTFSVELWFRTTTGTGGRLIGFGNSQSNTSSQYDRHVYMTDAGRLVFGSYVFGYDTIESTAAYNDGHWHHVAATLSPSGMRLYVDGAERAANTLYLTAELDSGYWRVGYDSLTGWPSAPSSASFEGTITDAAVYTTALTSAQVASHYAAGR